MRAAMSNYFYAIADAAWHSRAHDQIATVRMDDWDAALDALRDELMDGEAYDYVRNGDTLEYWAYDPDTDDDSMTMRVHVVRMETH